MNQGSGPEPEQLSMAKCAKLLNVPWRHVRRMIKRGVFAQPAGHDSAGQPYWHRRSLYAWAAADRDLLGRVPLHHWRPPTAQARYLGAETIEDRATALGWHTAAGPVWMLWHWDFDAATYERDLTELAKHLPGAAAITMVGGDYGADGPALFGVLPAAPARPVYEMPWPALSNVIGMPAPFWPRRLRIPDLMNAWRPGHTPVVAAAVPDLDPTPMLRLAVIVDEDSPAQQTLLNLVQTWQHRATMEATSDLKVLEKHTTAATTTVAATPLAVPAVEKNDLAPDIRRAGWLEILARTDDLALTCIRQARQCDADEDFPYTIDAHGASADASPRSDPPSDVERSRRTRRLRLTAWIAMLVATISVSTLILGANAPLTETELAKLRREAGLFGKERLKIGVKADTPGIALQEETGRRSFRGFDIDIAYMIAADLGYPPDKVDFLAIETEDRARMQTLDANGRFVRVDLVLVTFNVTLSRQQDLSVGLSAPYLYTEQSVVTRSDYPGKITSLEQLAGKKVCTLSASSSEQELKRVTKAIATGKNRISDCVAGLKKNAFDAVTADAAILAGFVAESEGVLRHHDIALQKTEMWAVNAGPNEALRTLVDLSLYRSSTIPQDRRWEQAYETYIDPMLSANPGVNVAQAEQPCVLPSRVRRWPWERPFPVNECPAR
ncbi:transporter substrate-binding domain-containing protein [Streptosporangium amethystogenes]|uniref:transporter substrate-binding domain-containing protein n=1 Tax=Streptosporangium amethystogenes TaxID=2002 RepID=UPI0037B98548